MTLLTRQAQLIILISMVSLECLHAQNTGVLKINNDSLQFYIETGNNQQAREFFGKTISLTNNFSDPEIARTFLLIGELEESDGFATRALTEYYKSKKIAHRNSSDRIEARSASGIASALIATGKSDSVIAYIKESLALDSGIRNQTLNHLISGRFWQMENLRDKALIEFQQANDKASRINDRKLTALALSGMGGIYFYQEPDMKRALAYYQQAVSLLDSSRHSDIIARNYGRIANACMVLGKTALAESFLLRAKKITDISGNLPVKSYIHASMAILKAEQGDIAAAVRYAEEPARIKRELGQVRQLQNDLLNLAEWHMELKNYPQAHDLILEGITTSTSLRDVVYLQYFYQRFSLLDSLTGNYQRAYTNLKKSMALKDSAMSLERLRAVEELREKYETEQKEKTIAEKELEIQSQKYRQAVIIGISAAAFLILVVFLVVIRNRHKIRLAREQQRQGHLRLQTIVHTQEDVQQSIARDIHDGLVQVLGAAKMSLQSITADNDRSLMFQRINEASAIVDEACAEARQISHQILPYSLMKDGLIPALEELLKKSLPLVEFKTTGFHGRLPNDIEINVYRIAQELVNNVIKHSEASQVQVDILLENRLLTFNFIDNGRGFEKTQTPGVGLTNILTRAALIGGNVKINSNPGEGTSIQLSVSI